jgi:hypothetical protein
VTRKTSVVVLEVHVGFLLRRLEMEDMHFILSYHVALSNVGIIGIATAYTHSITWTSYVCVLMLISTLMMV